MPRWAAITTGISPITVRTSTWARSRPTSSRRSRRPRSSTSRLPPSAAETETDPRAWPNHIAPRRDRGYQARPAAIASPMTAGRHYFPASREVFYNRDANSFSQADGLEPPGRQIFEQRIALGDISKARGDPAAADRARGLRGQRRGQEHRLYRRPRRRQPAISQ